MKTRELASAFRKAAEYLDSIEEFDAESCVAFTQSCKTDIIYTSVGFWEKDKFVAAVKAVGNATKKYDENSDYPQLRVTPTAYPLELSISRDKVCKKTVVYDCEPLFSEDEVNAL